MMLWIFVVDVVADIDDVVIDVVVAHASYCSF